MKDIKTLFIVLVLLIVFGIAYIKSTYRPRIISENQVWIHRHYIGDGMYRHDTCIVIRVTTDSVWYYSEYHQDTLRLTHSSFLHNSYIYP